MRLDPDGSPSPREVAPGVWWLGGCLTVHYQGQPLHNGNWAFLVTGEDAALLVEGGAPVDLPVLERQLAELLSDGPELRYIWATHQETPHAGGVGRLLSRHPNAQLIGDVRDYHLFFPELEDRLLPLAVGDSIDLGGSEFTLVEAVIRDLPTSQWGFDAARRILFTGDGFAYSHVHADGQCRKLAVEAPALPIADLAGLFAALALEWTTMTDVEPYIDRVKALLSELDVQTILPSHGLPITDLRQTVEQVYEGIRIGSRGESPGIDYSKLT